MIIIFNPKKKSEMMVHLPTQFTLVFVVVVLGGYPLLSISACSAFIEAVSEEVPSLSTIFLFVPALRGG